ncbi:hypothetical protein CSQ91_06810 [Janthinobacterium sp. BJB301]|nr:hypothetical protein CSQ91_06810 [Janthinobacterium sp. BJB301]
MNEKIYIFAIFAIFILFILFILLVIFIFIPPTIRRSSRRERPRSSRRKIPLTQIYITKISGRSCIFYYYIK